MGQSRPFQTYSPLYTKGNETDGKKILVFVECNRCPADSILISTGCRIGRRTYVFKDFGKVAATFVNLETQEAIRIRQVKHCYPEPGEDMLAYFENLPYDDFLESQRVRVPLGAGDMPGPPVSVAVCARCGEEVMDLRHVEKDGQCLCKSCAGAGYYQAL